MFGNKSSQSRMKRLRTKSLEKEVERGGLEKGRRLMKETESGKLDEKLLEEKRINSQELPVLVEVI